LAALTLRPLPHSVTGTMNTVPWRPGTRARHALLLLVAPILAAGCTAKLADGGGACTPTLTCAAQGATCGGFVDDCGVARACGTCRIGTCSKTDGTPGRCEYSGTYGGAGNPDPNGLCTQALPPEALPVSTASATSVVGTGTAASCTYAALAGAIARGGVITFSCGPDPVTLAVTATLNLDPSKDTVIDGGNKVTLDGGGAVRILSWNNGNWQVDGHVLTLQHLTLANGRAVGTVQFVEHPGTECPTGTMDGQGGALFMRDGVLHAVDVVFRNNQAALLGPDTGGGAVYLLGVKPATIATCSFLGNQASNGGGLGGLFATYTVYDSLFDGNDATGFGANDIDASRCPFIDANNPNHNQIGSGGNGGALYSDGNGANVTLCGTQIRSNHAGAYGAALFFTSNDGTGWLTIRDSNVHDNAQDDDWWTWPWAHSGISTNAKTNAPVNSFIQNTQP
jgi:hypothetical protein